MTPARSRSRSDGLLVLLVVMVLLLVARAGGAGAAPVVDPAGAGAAWIDRLAAASVPLKGFDGTSDDWGITLDAGLALASVGAPATSTARIWDGLVAARDTAVAPGGTDNPGRLARAVLLAVALGEDPRAVGAAPGADLVARLAALRTPSGTDAGLLGAADPTYDGVFRHAYGLMALAAAGAPVPSDSVAWLVGQQCADGSWMPYRADLTAPCVRNVAAFSGPDTNSTAAAVEALAAVAAVGPGADARAAGTGWLWSVRNADGGWGFFAEDGSDPNSTALTIQALLSVGADADPRFTAGPTTPPAALASFQLGCDRPEADRGALTFPDSGQSPNAFATVQGVPALAGQAFPVGTVEPGAAPEPLDCSPVTPSTTPTTVPDEATTTVPDGEPVPVEAQSTPRSATATTPPATTTPPPAVLGESVTRNVTTPGALAATGAASGSMVLLAAALVALGVGLSVAAGRR